MSDYIHNPEQAIDELHSLQCGIEFLSNSLPGEEPIGSLGYILSLFSDRMHECNRILDEAECREIEKEEQEGIRPQEPVKFEHPCPDLSGDDEEPDKPKEEIKSVANG